MKTTLTPADLGRVPPGCKVTVAAAVQGVALHDVYHAGQIRLLKRLVSSDLSPKR